MLLLHELTKLRVTFKLVFAVPKIRTGGELPPETDFLVTAKLCSFNSPMRSSIYCSDKTRALTHSQRVVLFATSSFPLFNPG